MTAESEISTRSGGEVDSGHEHNADDAAASRLLGPPLFPGRLCAVCQAPDSDGEVDDLTERSLVSFELDRSSHLVGEFRMDVEQAIRRTTSLHRSVR